MQFRCRKAIRKIKSVDSPEIVRHRRRKVHSVPGTFEKFLGIFARIRICGSARECFGDPRRLLMTRYFPPTFIGSRADDSAASEALQLGEMFGERIKRTFASFVCATTEIQFRDAADSCASSGSPLRHLASQRD